VPLSFAYPLKNSLYKFFGGLKFDVVYANLVIAYILNC